MGCGQSSEDGTSPGGVHSDTATTEKREGAGMLSKMATNKPTVLIIGASFGGLGAATTLVENDGASKFNIVLVDSKDYFTMGGLWQFVWNGRLTMDDCTWPLKDADLPGVTMKLGRTVTSWNAAGKSVQLDNGASISYEHIVLACGVVPDPTSLPGIENFVNICSEATVPRQKEEIEQFVAKAEEAGDSEDDKVVFVMAIGMVPYKCPPAPFELTFLVDEALRKAQVRKKATLYITCPVDWPMPPAALPPFRKWMAKKSIQFMENYTLENVVENTLHYASGETITADLIWSIWPIKAPDFVSDAIPVNPKGFVTVESKVTNSIPNLSNAYVVGDCCHAGFEQKRVKKALPKAGEFAWKMGVSAAQAILDDTQPASRDGECAAELGYDKALILHPQFSDVCNEPNGKPAMSVVEKTDGGQKNKLNWANGYIRKIFGEKARTVSL